MRLYNTADAAQFMLDNGGYFDSATLGRSLGMTAKAASGLLYNIRISKKYMTLDTGLPNRKIKVVFIYGCESYSRDLWRLALGLI